ncbi:MAG TPA: sensor histidine kinase [Terracidiphilus sp.]|nr:sensor histidine kinase [Terracidiphilus sp.]
MRMQDLCQASCFANQSGIETASAPFPFPGPKFHESGPQGLAELAHDARNMVTALGLCCELLEEPGVLTPEFRHYGSELRLLAATSNRLMDKLVALHSQAGVVSATEKGGTGTETGTGTGARAGAGTWSEWSRWSDGYAQAVARSADPQRDPQREPRRGQLGPGVWERLPETLIANLAVELESNRSLLSALAGPGIDLTLDIQGGAQPAPLSSEDLTRVLVNLLKNAVEAMPSGGALQLRLRDGWGQTGNQTENRAGNQAGNRLLLTMTDNGPGIAPGLLERIFEPGFTTRAGGPAEGNIRAADHLGLGLAITRSLVEAAGGRIQAACREPSGACFAIELPVGAA